MNNEISKIRLQKIAFGSVRQSQEEGVFIARELLAYKEVEKTAIARLDVQHSHPKPRTLSWLRNGIELPDGLYFVYASPELGKTTALNDVFAERQRQITAEGWIPEHDDQHLDNELAGAAACYAMNVHDFYIHYTGEFNWCEAPKPDDWPWGDEWWKPTNPRRDLVKAAALIIAEIERLDRAAIAKATGENQ